MSTHAVFHIPRSVCCGLLVHSSVGTYVSSLHLQAPVNSAAVNIHEQVLGSLFSVLLGIYLGVQSLGQEDPLEDGMAIHSSILAWRIPWTEEPGRPQSMGSQRVQHD